MWEWIGSAFAGGLTQSAKSLLTLQKLATLDQLAAANAEADPNFMRERANLAAVLGAVARNTNAAFVDTWGIAVISALSEQQNSVVMDVIWDSKAQHCERAPL